MIAARGGYTSICKLLLEHGARDFHQIKARPSSALHAATLSGNRDTVRLLLAHRNAIGGDEPNLSVSRQYSSSLRASQYASTLLGDIELFRELTSQEITDEECLRYAARTGDEVRVLELLDKRVQIDAQEQTLDHHRALESAIQGRHVALVKHLLAEGANPNSALGSPPLVEAVQVRDCEITRILLEAGAKVDVDVVVAAAYCGTLDVLSLLLDWRGDITCRNGSPIIAAARNGNIACFKELVRRGAALDMINTDEDGAHSLLCAAADGGSARLVEIIFEKSSFSKEQLLRNYVP